MPLAPLIGWTNGQVDSYLAFRDRARAEMARLAGPDGPSVRNWQIVECQNLTADGDGNYPGWIIQLNESFPERRGQVRLKSLAGAPYPGCYYLAALFENESNAWPVFLLANWLGDIYAELLALKDDGSWTEYSWKPLTPASGGGYTAGTQIGYVRGWVRVKVVTEGGTVNEVQSVAIIGATGGTFTLTYDGQTTSALAYDISAGSLETALEALSNITAVSVSGSGTFASPFLVTFQDSTSNVPLMTASYTNLTPNVSRNVAYEINNRLVTLTSTRRAFLKAGHGERAYVHTKKHQAGNGDDERTIYHVWLTGEVYGTWTLVFEEQTTAAIDYNANAAAVESALEALSNLTNVSVTGSGTAATPWVVTVLDDYADHDPLGVGIANLVGSLDYRFQGADLGRELPTSITCDGGTLEVTYEDV